MPTYYTLDNGGRPFKVVIAKSAVTVFPLIDNQDPELGSSSEDTYSDTAVAEFLPERVLVGVDPRDSQNKGNTVLLHLRDLEYVFIGQNIVSFRALAPITQYSSPVGNSDVPYPFAVDSDGRNYLITESAVVENVPRKFKSDPYEYYYRRYLITSDVGCEVDPITPGFQGVTGFYIDREPYTLTWTPQPASNFDRIRRDIGKWLFVIRNDKREKFYKSDYVDLMTQFGHTFGLSALPRFKELVPRQF